MYCTAIVVVHRVNHRTGNDEFLVMDYQTTFAREGGVLSDKEVRFPAGTNKDFPDETPSDTAVRKLYEETGLKALKVKRLGPNEGFGHIKFGFLIDIRDCSGELRSQELWTYDSIPAAKIDVMSAPIWKRMEDLDRGSIAPVQRWVFDLAYDEVVAVAA